MPECVHNTNVGFDLRYLGKNTIKLELYLHTCINLKIALEISTTTIVQLTSRSSLAKKKINIRKEIIDTGYIGNIIAILQNDFEKTYIIEPNEKIPQAIFLSLVKIAQLVSIRNRKKLGITAKKIQGFELMGRIDVPVNMRKVKDQIQIFEAEATLCESEKIRLVNLHISAKHYKHIKIPIYNNIGDIIEILEGTIIEYLSIEVEDQLSSTISDFPQLYQALRAVLLQKRPNKKEHPVAYTSRSLSLAKKNYGMPALEHLAIYWAPEAKAIQKADAKSIVKFIYQDLICQHGCPKKLLSD
ncbi:hypothetical protein G9A89_004638 [Geosiphon pyriformis]|nr:hypothetical protein G9A89_004638 [Geosiphon pyriformis]